MATRESSEDKYNIKAVSRCFQILDFAASHNGPVFIPDVCKLLDVTSNMAFRLLSTLETSGYMTKDERSGGFLVSLRSLQLSRKALQSLEIRRTIMPYLELLWNQFPNANANLGVFYSGEALLIDRIDSRCVPRTYFTPGKPLPFYCSGLGKVLVSQFSEQELDELIKKTKIVAFTPNTITDPEKIKAEIAKVRKEGVGRDRDEFILGDNCSAAPIQDAKGKIVAAISISSLDSNMSRDEIEAAVPKVRETASRISSLLGYGVVV